MFGSDFVVIKDHRGYESAFWWSDVLTVLGAYPGDGDEDWVKVKFRNSHQSDLHIEMSMTEFFESVEKQLNHPPRLHSDGEVICEAPATDLSKEE